MSLDNEMLANLGGITANSLNLLMEHNNIDIEGEPHVFCHSPYYDDKMFTDTLKNKSNVFTCLSINIQSLHAKIDQLRIYIHSLLQNEVKIGAILLQETWINPNNDTTLLEINGYNLISQPCKITSHGGLAIYILEEIEYELLDTINSESGTWEGLFIKLKLNSQNKLILGNVYRPPRDLIVNYTAFTNEFENHLQSLNGNTLIGGDFNIDLLKVNNKSAIHDYLNCILACGFIPSITLPTRLTSNTGTLIDNILCKMSNDISQITSGILTMKISDHQPIFVSLNYVYNLNKSSKYIKITKRDELSVEKFRAFLRSRINNTVFVNDTNANPNENYDLLNSIIKEGLEIHMPSKIVKFNKKKHKKENWITGGLVKSIAFRDKLYKKLKTTPLNNPLYAQLKYNLNSYNKILKKAIRERKKEYYHNCFEMHKNNMEKTWRTIKGILTKRSNENKLPDYYLVNNSKMYDKKCSANEFNKFFINIGPDLTSNIQQPRDISFANYLTDNFPHTFSFTPVTSNMVTEIINKLHSKSSTGFDSVSTILLKKVKNELVEILTLIINQSITTGIFPQKLKIAKVVPLHKKDDPTILNNYRPISILTAISKIFEKVMFQQIHRYFNNYNIYYSNQYGFRQYHSTELAQIELIDRVVTDMDKGKLPINIFIDLTKAFDTIDHSILLHKLNHYGFSTIALSLMESYLNNREQYIDLDGTTSSYMTLKSGVPQGSILGPLMFIIYINDMHKSSKMFNYISYADDTTLMVSLTNANTISSAELINKELENVNTWLKVNKLILNIEKTKCMIFHSPNKKVTNPPLKIGDCDIEFVENFNFLGVIINKHLQWKSHLDVISKKISKTIGIMNRVKHFLPQDTKLIMYKSLIESHLNYGILVWGYNCKNIEKLQKKAVRIICNSKYNAHSEPLLKKLKILKVKDILTKKLYNLFYKMSHSNLPLYFLDGTWLNSQSDTHNYNTRNNQFVTPIIKHTFAEYCVRSKLPELLNTNVRNITEKVHTHSEFGFTNYVKNFITSQYSDICTINNCYICNN